MEATTLICLIMFVFVVILIAFFIVDKRHDNELQNYLKKMIEEIEK